MFFGMDKQLVTLIYR